MQRRIRIHDSIQQCTSLPATCIHVVAILLCSVLCALSTANAQSVTGQISGTVTDPADARVAGARVQLTNGLTKQVRTVLTEADGNFLFVDLVPGSYSIRIAHEGFKAYVQEAVSVSLDEKVALHDIRLAVGDVTATVTVATEGAHVATDSSDRTIAVNSTQIANTPVRGRDWIGVVESLPGVVDLNNHDVPGWNSGMPTINGGQTGQVFIQLDGVGSQDSGSFGNNGYLAPSIDAISEVKVMVSNYSAEYGSRGGGQLVVTTKNGTNQFHGSAYFFHRNEDMNANEFFNNAAGLNAAGQQLVNRPLYRYDNEGGTFGGPLLIPGTRFNKSRNKLFFFFSEDYLGFLQPGGLNKFTMPTALERRGDYSQTTTTTGTPIVIKDPSTGLPYPGNVIPASQISPAGSAMLNLFPLPFTSDPTGQRQYNAIYQFSRHNPHEDRILRFDYNISPGTQAFVRLMNDYQADRGIGSTLNGTGGWGQLATDYGIQSAGVVATVVHTFSPTLVNELTAGVNRAHQSLAVESQAQLATNQLPALKGPDGQVVALPKIYPGNGTGLMSNLIPNIRFTQNNAQQPGLSVPNAPSFTFDARFPFDGTDQLEDITDTITWIKSAHSIKAGFYYERMARNVSIYSQYNVNGSYWFGTDGANLYDSGYPYSNALIGSVQSYGEDGSRIVDHVRANQVEWFVQDSWRATRRLTLDYGIRFQYPGALYSPGMTLGFFDSGHYNPSQAGTLLFPAVVNGQKVAENLQTGAVYPYARVGAFDPASYAGHSPYSGMVQYTSSAWQQPGLAYAPRIGFGLDVLGNGKMALRGGFGIFHDRPFGVALESASGVGVGPEMAPPTFQAPTYYNTTIPQLTGATGFLTPQGVFQGTQYKTPATYNWSIGIQRNLGSGLILDVAYVGNAQHHIFQQVAGNGIAPYTDWTPTGGLKPAYIDPTNTSTILNANLFRPYTGYGAVNISCSCGESNYNSLQLQVNRRFGKRLQWSANWTWDKTMTYGTRSPWTPDRLQYAELGSDRPQIVNINYSYMIPDGSRIWKNKFTEILLDGWHFNGITKIMSGNPLTITCGANGAPAGYWTGTPTGGIPFRCQMAAPGPFLPAGSAFPAVAQPNRYYPFNAANFSLPSATSLGIGNTPPTMFFGPGFENFDFSLLKDIRLGKQENRILELRAEAYNVFNHFNPGNPNTSLTLNYSNGANTNANFGTISGVVGQARHIAVAAKFRF